MNAIGFDRPLRSGVAGLGGLIFALAVGVPLTQAGADFCVTCADPAAEYKCQVDRQGAVASPGALQLYCIRQLAAQGGHARCSVRRRSTSSCQGEPRLLVYGRAGTTPGPTLSIRTPSAGGPSQGAPSARSPIAGAPIASTPPVDQPNDIITRDDPGSGTYPGAAQSPPAETAPAPRPLTVKKGPPKTVAEMAKRAASASKRQMKKAGNAVTGAVKKTGKTVGDAASKTWNCLVSLFSKC